MRPWFRTIWTTRWGPKKAWSGTRGLRGGHADLEIPFEEKLERFFALGEDAGNQPSEESLAGWDWSDEGIRSIYEAFVADRQVPFLKRFVELGKAEGAIRSDLPTEAILVYFEANMSIYRDEALLSKGKEHLSSLSHLFFYGLLGR